MKITALMLWLAAIPQLALAQGVEDPLSYQVLLRMSGGLLLVVALVFAAAWGVRRFGRLPSTGNSTLRLLGGVAVGQRERVVLIKVGDERVLIGVAPGRVQMLHTLTDDLRPTSEATVGDTDHVEPQPRSAPETFQHRLRDLLTRSGAR